MKSIPVNPWLWKGKPQKSRNKNTDWLVNEYKPIEPGKFPVQKVECDDPVSGGEAFFAFNEKRPGGSGS